MIDSMLNDLITVGDKVYIIRKTSKSESEETKEELVSQLYEWIDETHLKLAMPIKEGMTVPLNVGLSIELNFYGVRGLYYCKAEIIDRGYEDELAVLNVSITSDVERLQRRQFYRLENAMDIEYQVREAESNDLQSSKKPWCQAKVTDISGGGICFISKEKLEKDSSIRVRLSFNCSNTYYEYFIQCNVVTTEECSTQIGRYKNRLEFKEIPIDQQENIIKYIFEVERHRRHMSKIQEKRN
ncbi:flagellar protein [Lachnospiraceae bacterium KM106-2]|nr:flagellar protein [Lachnospiraceae bacterium KM106-2]